MRRLALLLMLALGAAPLAVAAQTTVPSPRPFPGAPAPPASSRPTPPPSQAPTDSQTPPASAAAPAAPTGPNLPGVPPVYPTAEYLATIDAGAGQDYVLYGTDASFAEIVAYYRTVLKNGGREIYRTPGIHQFDLGRFDENRMAYPPSVVIKDYVGGTPPGYLHVAGTEEKRFRTVIQVVPPATAAR